MRQTELRLSAKDRQALEEVRSKGLHHAREVNRAHILAALDRQVPQAMIMEVLGVERTAIWRTRAAYLAGGLEQALYDEARPVARDGQNPPSPPRPLRSPRQGADPRLLRRALPLRELLRLLQGIGHGRPGRALPAQVDRPALTTARTRP